MKARLLPRDVGRWPWWNYVSVHDQQMASEPATVSVCSREGKIKSSSPTTASRSRPVRSHEIPWTGFRNHTAGVNKVS
ncbi:hypothetical protein BRADI_1g51903v3 [Brachypodium distachyon]|uniref:Uncharacterized protein n=1 Tax=Brachypodium distachyon TaxID=15368 RepID=A0A2K2DR02_BRADI|nr:hypothetical protein BRADI_1g51903v3 [Brachypodium distachyon]